jgi:hypothetical protein
LFVVNEGVMLVANRGAEVTAIVDAATGEGAPVVSPKITGFGGIGGLFERDPVLLNDDEDVEEVLDAVNAADVNAVATPGAGALAASATRLAESGDNIFVDGAGRGGN